MFHEFTMNPRRSDRVAKPSKRSSSSLESSQSTLPAKPRARATPKPLSKEPPTIPDSQPNRRIPPVFKYPPFVEVPDQSTFTTPSVPQQQQPIIVPASAPLSPVREPSPSLEEPRTQAETSCRTRHDAERRCFRKEIKENFIASQTVELAVE